MEKLIALYESWHGSKPSRTETIAAGGSNRQYYRIVDGQGKSVIGVIGTSRDENHAFIYLARHFTRRQLPVPQNRSWRMQCTARVVAVHCGSGCSALRGRLQCTASEMGKTGTEIVSPILDKRNFCWNHTHARHTKIKAVSLCFIRYSLFL